MKTSFQNLNDDLLIGIKKTHSFNNFPIIFNWVVHQLINIDKFLKRSKGIKDSLIEWTLVAIGSKSKWVYS
jgi:hypothetical protein